MNVGNLHLVLNHIPTIGFGIALAIYVASLVFKKPELRRACFVMFFLAAAISIATYVSGNDALQHLKEVEGISVPLMEAHESAAFLALLFMEITGFLAWVNLWIGERPSRFARWNVVLVLVFAILSFALMSRAAYIGGAIRHTETEAAASIPVNPDVPTLARAWGVYVADTSWVWPACETLHFVGLCLLLGVVLVVNLRLLGIGKSLLSASALHQLIPLGMLGFSINLITGMLFIAATPEQYTGSFFFLKIGLIVAGAINLLCLMLGRYGEALWGKVLAFSAIAIWIGVVFVGHMLPWLGNSF